MINMAFERGSTDIEEHHQRGRLISEMSDRVSHVELFLPEGEEAEEMPGVVPEMRTRSSSTRSSASHHTRSARSSSHSHRSIATSHRRSPHEALLSPLTPNTHSPMIARHGLLSREGLPSTPMHRSPVHNMPPSALNNNSLTRSLNLLPDTVFAEEPIEMTQMTHFTHNSFINSATHNHFHNHLTVGNAERMTSLESRVHVPKLSGNFCAHTDGECVQIMLIGGKCDEVKIVGDKFLPDQMSVWRCCIRKL
jgi:hypothetical protein